MMGQDIYDLENSKKYANYLFQSQEYKLAAQEYERITFLDSADQSAQLRLVKSYRLLNKPEPALRRLHLLFPLKDTMPSSFANEYTKLLISNGQLSSGKIFLNTNQKLANNEKDFYLATINMYQKNWEAAYNLLDDSLNGGIYYLRMKQLANDAMNFKYKKPWLSMSLSTIIPGLGKMYCGYWKDGLVSLLFVGMSAWQSYRGFSKNGINSVYGWIYGGVSLGFYIGNIYGSGKSANKYNHKHDHKLLHEVESIYINY